MVDTPIKPELSPTEVAVLQKARKSSTRRGVHVFGDEADVAKALMGDDAPKITGRPDGGDIVLGGLTAAGLMALDDWLKHNEGGPAQRGRTTMSSTIDEIIEEARALYDNAANINSLSGAQAAVRQVAKTIFNLAKHVKAIEEGVNPNKS